MTDYLVTDLGGEAQWVVSVNAAFVAEETSLADALGYLAGVLNFGDTITYVDEPVLDGNSS